MQRLDVCGLLLVVVVVLRASLVIWNKKRFDGHALDSISKFYPMISDDFLYLKEGDDPQSSALRPLEKSIFVCFFDVRRKIIEVELVARWYQVDRRGIVRASYDGSTNK